MTRRAFLLATMLLLGVVVHAQAPTSASLAASTVEGKIKLTIVLSPTGSQLPPGTLQVWSIEGDSQDNRLGTLTTVAGDGMSMWYAPTTPVTRNVRVSFIVDGKSFGARLDVSPVSALQPPSGVKIIRAP